MPASTKNKGHGSLISSGYTTTRQNGGSKITAANGASDPFAKVNSKARKLIESVERNRNSTVERRMGSTGGSSTQQVVEITGGVVNPSS